MRRFLQPYLLVAVIVFSTASMCNDDEDNTDETTRLRVETSLGLGTWRVTYFFDQKDETSDFNGYSFQFNEGGVAAASKNALSIPGSWHTEDSSNGSTKLYLDFGTSDPLEELNEDWIVTSYSGTKISLEHISGGNGDTDSLVLERN